MVSVEPMNSDRAGFHLDLPDANPNDVSSFLTNDIGMLPNTTPVKDGGYELDYPETVEEALLQQLRAHHNNEEWALEFVQDIDDIVFDAGSPFDGGSVMESRRIPRIIINLYNATVAVTSDNSGLATLPKRKDWQLVLSACVYMAVRAYMDCALTIYDGNDSGNDNGVHGGDGAPTVAQVDCQS